MMLTKKSNGYDQARLGFQRRDPHRPDVIFPVTSAAEVEEAVRYAAEHNLRLAVQASGHGLAKGLDGGVLIATGALNGVRVDPGRKTAWIEAGATWRDVIDATAPYGLAPLSGSFPGVGAISYTLGGGLGLMARRYGYAADHVRRIEIVTPDGVRRDAEDDPELFWAVRGGGGNFGVVTGIEVDLFDVATLYGGSLYFDFVQNLTVLHVWADWTRSVPDQVTSAMALVPLPDIPQVPAPLRGRYVAQVQLAILGAGGEDLIKPLRAIGEPVLDTVGELPYTESGKIFAEPERPDSYRSQRPAQRPRSGGARDAAEARRTGRVGDVRDRHPSPRWCAQPRARGSECDRPPHSVVLADRALTRRGRRSRLAPQHPRAVARRHGRPPAQLLRRPADRRRDPCGIRPGRPPSAHRAQEQVRRRPPARTESRALSGAPEDLLDQPGLRFDVRRSVGGEEVGQLALQGGVPLPVGGVRPQTVAQQHMVLMRLVAFDNDVQVVVVRGAGRKGERLPSGNAEVALVLVAGGNHRRDGGRHQVSP
nr:FAD-binding protein [Kribbella capetownensis]